MSELLNDKLNLDILEHICSGAGVEVNISLLSNAFKRHRNTIKQHVQDLYDHNILNKPIYPFMWLYQEFPLLVVARADLPKSEEINRFFSTDEHIFAAFFVRDEEYNTLLIEYHKDLFAYGEWRNMIVEQNKIPPRQQRYPTHSLFFSTKHIMKYQPHSPILTLEDKIMAGEEPAINDLKINNLSFQILKKLMLGEGIRTNENILAEKLKVHRKTIERRIEALLKAGIISSPVCRFPKFFVPPNHILVYYLLEIHWSKEKLLSAVKFDHHIPFAVESGMGRYNLLLFGVFSSVEEHFAWEANFENRFPGCIGAMKKIYLSPKMTASIDQQKVSLGIIKHRRANLGLATKNGAMQ